MPHTRFARRTRTAGLALIIAWASMACRERDPLPRPGSAYTPYVAAFTSGTISARSPIVVRIADDARWRDTVGMDLRALFQFKPAVEGRVRFEDDRTIVFVPEGRLAQNRTYRVSFQLGRVVETPEELKLFSFSVTTPEQRIQARVSDMRSLSATDLTWQRLTAEVYTSDDATGQDLAGCFAAVQGGRALPLSWEHEPNGRHHRFTVDSVRRGEGPSEVAITWDGKSIGAGKGDLAFTVPSIGQLALLSWTTHSDGEQYATFHFSDPLDPAQDLEGLVGIAGADDARPVIDGHTITVHPRNRLSGKQDAYISAAVRNVNGRRLGKDLTVELLFEDLKPAVRFIGKGTILPSTDGQVLPFQAVNLKAVEVRVVRIMQANVAQFLQVNALDGDREMARVGRLVGRRTVPLNTPDGPDLGRWNTYHVDLSSFVKTEPGAIYRVELGFGAEHSAFPCEAFQGETARRTTTLEEEQAAYDHYEPEYRYYYDYDDEDYYWYSEEEQQQRNDPCNAAYYRKQRSIARNVLASDIGLIAKTGTDGATLVAVSDLRSARPLSGVRVELLDLQRRTLGNAVSDREGLVTFPSAARKPFLLVASKGTQRGYLKLDDGSSLSLSSFDTGGETVDKGLKGMIYGERGVWRPGDTLFLNFMLHDPLRKLPKDHPVTLEITDPRGRLDQKHVRNSSTNGVYAFRCTTPPDAPTGVWHATVRVGGTTFHKSLRIETVKPNRLKVSVDIPGQQGDEPGRLLSGPTTIGLRANWLHGAPANGLKARVTMNLSAGQADFRKFADHTFSDLRSSVSEEEATVFEDHLDRDGKAGFTLEMRPGRTPPPVINVNLVARVFEAGGDASMDRATARYFPFASYAGVRMPEVTSPWGTLVTDTTYAFSVVNVDAEGNGLPGRNLRAQVYKLDWNWWWDGGYDQSTNYITSPSAQLLQEHEITTDAKGRATLRFKVDRPLWGRFAVRITDPASGHSSAVQVYLDWPGWEGRSRRQDPAQAAMLTFNADRERYTTGDQATLIIPSGGSGRALVSLETGSRVLDAVWVDLKDKETRHTFRITQDMVPTVYAHVTVVQPHEKTLNDLPIRLYGVTPLHVEDPTTRITPRIALSTARATKATELRTAEPFTVEVDETDGRPMTYTLAIVDEGLLDLTRFRTPDPWKHFHAREALGVRTWDLYDQVIGSFGRQLQRVLAIGGSDELARGDAARANRFKPVVRHVGPFRLDPGKKARHSFTIDNYVGSVRVMVVATDGERAYGHAEQAMPVRKPLMVLATLPRVLGPGETAELPVTVFAMDPKVKDVRVRIEPNDMLLPVGPAEQTIRFSAVGDQVVRFTVKARDAVGVARMKVSASGAGENAEERIELGVRQANLPITEVTEAVVEAGKSWSSVPLPVGVKGTNSAYLEVSGIPPVDLGRRLQYLVGYPHGCLEQTVSRGFPQLFLARVVELPLRIEGTLRTHVEAAIAKLGRFQRSDGGFNYWPGGDHYDDWTSVYAGHFMVEAERLGYAVPAHVRNGWTSYQRKAARAWNDERGEGWSVRAHHLVQAYRLYVLALAGATELPAMNRLRERAGLSTTARWMLAAAYAHGGRKDVARDLVKGLTTTVEPYTEQGWTYGSDLRDEALIAEALLAIGDDAQAALVVQRIAKRLSSDSWHSTQGTAFGLMAVARLADKGDLGKTMRYRLTVAGKTTDRVSNKAFSQVDLPVPDGNARVALTNTGDNLLYVRVVRTGTPMAGGEKAQARGVVMDVSYRTMDGEPIDPARIVQGTDIVAVVTVANPGGGGALKNLALSQVFPSGWEIRNTRLEGTEDLGPGTRPTYQDIRDDRVLTYFDLAPRTSAVFHVLLNASYTGRYYLPGAHLEAMYDNTIHGRDKGRWVEVVQAGGDTAKR